MKNTCKTIPSLIDNMSFRHPRQTKKTSLSPISLTEESRVLSLTDKPTVYAMIADHVVITVELTVSQTSAGFYVSAVQGF